MSSTFFKKITPFLEHIVMGSLFLLLGKLILQTYDAHVLGFLAVIAFFWGGFQCVLGCIIYGLTAYAYLFVPDSFVKVRKNTSLERVEKRIEKDLQRGFLHTAIQRYHGLIATNPNEHPIKFKLAALYLIQGDLPKAGQYFYLKPSPRTEEEDKAIQCFRKSVGGDPFQILRRVIRRSNVEEDYLVPAWKTVYALVDAIQQPTELRSDLVKRLLLVRSYKKRSLLKRLYEEEFSVFVQLVLLALGFLWILLF